MKRFKNTKKQSRSKFKAGFNAKPVNFIRPHNIRGGFRF